MTNFIRYIGANILAFGAIATLYSLRLFTDAHSTGNAIGVALGAAVLTGGILMCRYAKKIDRM
jgi:hypothetical protein